MPDEDEVAAQPRRVIGVILPGATAVIDSGASGHQISVPLWGYWLQIADEAAKAAMDLQPSDRKVDAMSARLAGLDVPIPDEPEQDRFREMQWSMIAISASAHAIDGLYGSVRDLIAPPSSDARRNRQILEALKLGFQVGKHAHKWLSDLDWLFDERDQIVHHAEALRPVVVARVTEETVVFGGPESYGLSGPHARRAAAIAGEVIRECLRSPKPATANWARSRREFVGLDPEPVGRRVEVGDTRTPLIGPAGSL